MAPWDRIAEEWQEIQWEGRLQTNGPSTSVADLSLLTSPIFLNCWTSRWATCSSCCHHNQAWIFLFTAELDRNRKHSQEQFLRGVSPLNVWRTTQEMFCPVCQDKTRSYFNLKHCFSDPNQQILCLNLKLCDKRKKYQLSLLWKNIYLQQSISTSLRYLHRDRCVSCRLIGSGPYHCEASGGGGPMFRKPEISASLLKVIFPIYSVYQGCCIRERSKQTRAQRE